MNEYRELKYKLNSVTNPYGWVIHGEVLTATTKQNKLNPIGVYNRTTSQLAENIEILEDNISMNKQRIENADIRLTSIENSEEISNLTDIVTDAKLEINSNKQNIQNIQNNSLEEYIIIDKNNFTGTLFSLETFNFIKSNNIDKKILLKRGLYKLEITVKMDIYENQILSINGVEVSLDKYINDITILNNTLYYKIEEEKEFSFSFDVDVVAKYISIEITKVGV